AGARGGSFRGRLRADAADGPAHLPLLRVARPERAGQPRADRPGLRDLPQAPDARAVAAGLLGPGRSVPLLGRGGAGRADPLPAAHLLGQPAARHHQPLPDPAPGRRAHLHHPGRGADPSRPVGPPQRTGDADGPDPAAALHGNHHLPRHQQELLPLARSPRACRMPAAKTDHKVLFTPGPTEVAPEILREMARPVIGHRGEEMQALIREIMPRARTLFGTRSHDVFLTACSATGLWEAAVRNCVARRVLVPVCGSFSERLYEVALACGVEADPLHVEWGR